LVLGLRVVADGKPENGKVAVGSESGEALGFAAGGGDR
jgi:hypothetical protein